MFERAHVSKSMKGIVTMTLSFSMILSIKTLSKFCSLHSRNIRFDIQGNKKTLT